MTIAQQADELKELLAYLPNVRGRAAWETLLAVLEHVQCGECHGDEEVVRSSVPYDLPCARCGGDGIDPDAKKTVGADHNPYHHYDHGGCASNCVAGIESVVVPVVLLKGLDADMYAIDEDN